MTMSAPIFDFLSHMAWADAMAIHAWSKAEPENQDLRERWEHLAWVQEGFLKVLRGEDAPWEKKATTPTFDELRAWAQRNQEALLTFSQGLSSEDLARKVRIPWFPEPPCVITVGEALTQVAMHTQHHRAQVMTRLVQLGHKGVNVDYIIWLWKGRPEPRW